MDFTVEVGEPGLVSEPAPSAPASVNQAGEAAEAEYAKMMSDKTHKHYEGFRRGDKAAEDYANEIFRKAHGDTKGTSGEGVAGTTSGPEQVASAMLDAQEGAEDERDMAQFRADVAHEGIEYETALQEAREVAQVLIGADPTLYHVAAKRLGDPMALRLLRILRPHMNLM